MSYCSPNHSNFCFHFESVGTKFHSLVDAETPLGFSFWEVQSNATKITKSSFSEIKSLKVQSLCFGINYKQILQMSDEERMK